MSEKANAPSSSMPGVAGEATRSSGTACLAAIGGAFDVLTATRPQETIYERLYKRLSSLGVAQAPNGNGTTSTGAPATRRRVPGAA